MALPAIATSDAIPAVEQAPRSRAIILCVDDDPDICKIWRLRLVPHGVEVLTAANGKIAFLTAVDAAPDLILLDLNLPDENGHRVLDRMRADPRTHRIPVFMLTGDDIPTAKRRVFGHLANEYLAKPIDFRAVLEKIFTYLRPTFQAAEALAEKGAR